MLKSLSLLTVDTHSNSPPPLIVPRVASRRIPISFFIVSYAARPWNLYPACSSIVQGQEPTRDAAPRICYRRIGLLRHERLRRESMCHHLGPCAVCLVASLVPLHPWALSILANSFDFLTTINTGPFRESLERVKPRLPSGSCSTSLRSRARAKTTSPGEPKVASERSRTWCVISNHARLFASV